MATIDISKIKNNYLTLPDAKEVVITGKYIGDRIVIKNANNKTINFRDGRIHTDHREDALVFADDVKNCRIQAENFSLFFGGLTFWKMLTDVVVIGFDIYFPHTGIRATQDLPHRNVSIIDNNIQSASHEGIYMGVSKDTENKATGLRIEGNKLSQIGWDGIQAGNWKNVWIGNNSIMQAGMVEEWGQWHGICVNPGSQAWIWGNEIELTEKKLIVNQATAYLEKPKK